MCKSRIRQLNEQIVSSDVIIDRCRFNEVIEGEYVGSVGGMIDYNMIG